MVVAAIILLALILATLLWGREVVNGLLLLFVIAIAALFVLSVAGLVAYWLFGGLGPTVLDGIGKTAVAAFGMYFVVTLWRDDYLQRFLRYTLRYKRTSRETTTAQPPSINSNDQPVGFSKPLAEMHKRLMKGLAASELPIGKQQEEPGRITVTFPPRRRQPAEPGSNTAPLNPVVRDLLGFLLQNDYVCPSHAKWLEMWCMIPEDENGHKAGGPVPLEAWSVWPNRERHACLVRHIECADARGVIDKIDNYLRHSVKPDEWITGLLTA